jgi:Holliday junction resolvase
VTESDIQNAIRLRLSELGFAVFRTNVGKVRMPDGRWFNTGLPKGHPDLYAVKSGKIYYIEVKTPTGKVSAEQEHFIATMRDRYGCVAGVVRSVEDAERLVSDG